MKIDSVRFATPVRVDGNTFLTGITPDNGAAQWDMKVDHENRVVLLRGKGKKDNQLWAVPFENVACMRLVDDVSDGTRRPDEILVKKK